jgi:uncharacterized protein (DUF1697 family)
VRYLALLRGINVGGKNIIKAPDLRSAFEGVGCTEVTTYIQSGNVLLETASRNVTQLPAAIEAALAAEFACHSLVVLISKRQLESVVENAPSGFGEDPAQYRYDIVFLKAPARADAILPTIRLREGVDGALAANGVLYFSRLTVRASQSYLSKLTSHPAYKSMTIRNWNTTRELYRLMRSPRT